MFEAKQTQQEPEIQNPTKTTNSTNIMSQSESKITNFTFGVEIEFILAYRWPADDDRYNDEIEDDMRNTYIRKPLIQAGLQVHNNEIDVSDDPDFCYTKWWVKTDDTVEATQEDLDRIGGRFANGVKADDFDDLSYTDVELVSPVMTFSAEAMREVQTAVETICKQSVFAPRSAALHVHIGNGGTYFELPFLKNLAVLTSCFEQQWNQAIPPHFLNDQSCQLPRYLFFAKDYHREAMAKMIFALPDVGALIRRFHVHPALHGTDYCFWDACFRDQAINFLNQTEFAGYNDKKTVEFRQQAGTVDPFEVLRWIVTVGAIAAIANEYPPGFFWEVIRKHVQPTGKDDWTFSLLELFGDFDVDWLSKLWEQGGLYVHEENFPSQC